MKIALCQMQMSNSIEENHDKILDAIEKASAKNADLILFPEIQYSIFFPQYKDFDASSYAFSINHIYVKEIQELCAKKHIMAAPNIYLLEDGKKYDATILINNDGSIVGVQKMVHIAQAERFYEQDYYTESNDGFLVFDTPYGKIGIVVCFDRHYPESVRTEVLMGADLILIPTANTKAEPLEMFEWETRVEAFQNSVIIAMCNRTGKEDKMDFCGESLVIDCDGKVIVKADECEQIIYADIDLQRVKEYRESKNYTSLRRIELYK